MIMEYWPVHTAVLKSYDGTRTDFMSETAHHSTYCGFTFINYNLLMVSVCESINQRIGSKNIVFLQGTELWLNI